MPQEGFPTVSLTGEAQQPTRSRSCVLVLLSVCVVIVGGLGQDVTGEVVEETSLGNKRFGQHQQNQSIVDVLILA